MELSREEDTTSLCSFGSRADLHRLSEAPMPSWVRVGEPVIVTVSHGGTRTGSIQFVGLTEFAAGTWVGVELDSADGNSFSVLLLHSTSVVDPRDDRPPFTLTYLTFGVGRLLHLPSAEAISVRPNAEPRCNQKVTVIGYETETSAVRPKSAVKPNKSPATWDW